MIFLLLQIIQCEVPSNIDLLMTKQTYGQTRRNVSVDGNPLTIAGLHFDDGIGTHATSMIPVTVPKYAVTFTGACGIDDDAKSSGKASVKFSILSGSEVLWMTDVMKEGDAPASFSVSIPEGCHKLYLVADEVDKNECDHADWVNLKFETANEALQNNPHIKAGRRVLRGSKFGLIPNVLEDQGPILRRMITSARSNPGSTIFIEKGVYHFYEENALKMSFHVSNHDQPTFQPICVPLVDLDNVVLDASGSTFIFHGQLEPILVMDSTNVTINNLHIDFWRPYYSEATVVALDYFSTTLRFNKTLFPYHISDGTLIFDNEGFTVPATMVIAYDKETRHIIPGVTGIGFPGAVVENEDGTVTVSMNLRNHNVKEGDVLAIRSGGRPHPGVVVYRSVKTTFNNFFIHDSQGMGLLCQRSEDIYFINSGVTSGTPERYHSSSCDASHFSNVKGEIVSIGNVFEGMLDDAINVHATSLKIVEKVNESCIKIQYMHGQSVGFETFLPGEKIQFIHSSTLELGSVMTVKNVEKLSTTQLLILLDGNVPSDINTGDAVENGDYYPSVLFQDNIVRNNLARACLFTTPKSVKALNNFFNYTAGSAILLAGDAANWYESGACRSVEIRGNKVVNALTSTAQFTNAIFSFVPTVNNIASQKVLYHSNVTIENNLIETFDVPLLYAASTNTINFRNNTIIYNDDFPSWNQRPFKFNKVQNIHIHDNNVDPEKKFTIDDVDLENTDSSEIHFQ
ncbi:Alpha-1,3-galactosidase B [Tritrichomonas foetus]|uniref:Alpha-1,3-galactosidase B n=1 Tax=Tritrichomonas foetus TaxID=1144522 RepID=A0A1J4KBV1_9EUKA|nr:Alpha-1,3-galactosidase B [Tritrichomonas foetus]|eukprot:OHT08400.1 Alpha-1,3-galactosidase B [Tritrichomonas foetus]